MTLDPETFCAFLAMQDLADSTIRNYRALYVRWCDWALAHDRDPERPDPLAVRAWSHSLNGGQSTKAQARAVIGHACAALGVDDVSAAVPVQRSRQRPPRALPEAQAGALESAAHRAGHKGTAVLVGLYTAGRRSEIASLAWGRIDWEREWVTLKRPKNDDLHTVPLHPVLGEHLAARRVPGEQWVFPGRYGGHVSPATVWQWVLDVAEMAGLPRVVPHELRHTALTTANDATGDLRAVQLLAGHSSPTITARYTRASQRALDRAVMALDYAGATR